MRKEWNPNDGDICYFIKGEAGKEYPFKCKSIILIDPNSHFIITNSMTVYAFVQDIEAEIPKLILLGYSNDWSIKAKDIKDFNLIIKHNAVSFLYYRIEKNESEVEVYFDIKNGSEFDRELYEDQLW